MKIYNKLIIVLICVYISVGIVFASVDSESLSQSIIALDKTRINIDKELTKQNLSLLSDRERYEYDIFLEYIDAQINHYCNKLYKMNDLQDLEDLPCKVKFTHFNNRDYKDIKTMEEQVVSMEDMLMSSLGDFDEMLLKEEEILNKKTSANKQLENKSELERYLKAKVKNKGAENKESNQISKDKNDEKHGMQDDGMQGKEKNNRNNSGKSGKTGETASQQKNKSRKIETADDDIVARQLREAAEQETDPELKKKLWEEYDKYRQ